MDEREAAIAPLRHNGACVEVEGFDKVDNVVVSHSALCWIGGPLSLSWFRAEPIQNAAA
jgi:hypothetical protein